MNSLSLKYVAPLFREMSLAKTRNTGGGWRPQRPPTPVAPLVGNRDATTSTTTSKHGPSVF